MDERESRVSRSTSRLVSNRSLWAIPPVVARQRRARQSEITPKLLLLRDLCWMNLDAGGCNRIHVDAPGRPIRSM